MAWHLFFHCNSGFIAFCTHAASDGVGAVAVMGQWTPVLRQSLSFRPAVPWGLQSTARSWPGGLSGTPHGCNCVDSHMEFLWKGSTLPASSPWGDLIRLSLKEVKSPKVLDLWREYETYGRELFERNFKNHFKYTQVQRIK